MSDSIPGINKIVEPGSVPDKLYDRQVWRKVSYLLWRLRTEAEGGPKAAKTPKGFKKFYQEQQWWDGWENFRATWDLDQEDPSKVVPRWRSVHEEWEEDVIGSHVKMDLIASRQRRRRAEVQAMVEAEEVTDGIEGDL